MWRKMAMCVLCLVGGAQGFAQILAEPMISPIPKEHKIAIPAEEVVETHHSIRIAGVEVPYKAMVGTQNLTNEAGESKASIFYVAYTRENAGDLRLRPILFCFNGGPGSASVWLHMGMIGPKRVEFNDEGTVPVLPNNFIDNPYSLLDVADLVFIDPISTGYSRTVLGEDPKQYHAVTADIQSIAQFIRLYTTRNLRWESPKFLVGESYGTLRAAGLALELHNEDHFELNGIVLISSVLNYQTIAFDDGNDLPYILYLPSYTAAAFYHKRLPEELLKDLAATLKEVESFALNEYTVALMQGDNLSTQERQAIVEKLARYTGLPPDYIDKANLRVNIYQFAKRLLESESRCIGRFDSRVKGYLLDRCSDHFEFDPAVENIVGPFTAAFNQYVRADLNWKTDIEYKTLASVHPWDYDEAKNQYLDMADKLRSVMTFNPNLRVFVASGYYDLATPYFSTAYTFSHLGLDPSLRPHVTLKYYPGGHLVFLYRPNLIQMKQEIASFITQ